MNINRMRTSASSKLILGAVMAICFVVAPAHAQSRVSHFTGTFVLTNDVQWGKALLHPGTYSLAVDPVDSKVESIDVYDAGTGKFLVGEMNAISYNTTADSSEIVIAIRGDQRAVESLQLAGMGEVLHETHPFATSGSRSEEAFNTQAIPVEAARK
jgi:hypothetical protein